MHSLAAAAIILTGLAKARSSFAMVTGPGLRWQIQGLAADSLLDEIKVPVVLGVMSRCPDALLCEAVFDQVLKEVEDKVDISLSFIAKDNTSEPIFGVTCLHGPLECAGNVQELCAAKYLPQHEWWSYVHCQNFYGRYKVGTPEVAQKCANTVGFDWDDSGVGTCAILKPDREGVQLLKESVQGSRDLGIQKSCTVLINGKQVCIHDETWKECDDGHTAADFVRQINQAYDELNKRSLSLPPSSTAAGPVTIDGCTANVSAKLLHR